VSDPVAVAELLATYAATAERWHDMRGGTRRPIRCSARTLARALRCWSDGRAAMAALIGHSASGVRVPAAAQSLDHGEAAAVAALEALAGGGGLQAIAGAHALEQLRVGSLQLGW
jgi:hypothetical protein